MKSRGQVREIVFGQSSEGIGCEIRGPLTIAQVEKEMTRRTAEENRAMRKKLAPVIAHVEREVNKLPGKADEGQKKELTQVLKSIRLRMRDAEGASSRFKGPEWREFCDAYREGGEVYYVKSGPQTWREHCGSEMYVTIRENKVSSKFLIATN
jgi:hypothetical protein